ncbi:uncharacterized protein LOC119642294 [Glossina fuscipes]|uniref:Uncharacterized protein LOC119642294 n=1 Tax=Glossina fuscipes TaxID=7396 RepID=A0A9C5ZEV0_9MUSC|nr:uncharacterized protein LOC119642294 [Glossina fuscipes]
MHKYQQLLLLIIFCVSVICTLMYKTENNRLKDVLHVINFFGRKYAAILRRIDNINNSFHYLVDFIHPLPVWQLIVSKINKGQLPFQRLDKEARDGLSEFTRYRFYCRITRDFGQPKSVPFTEVTNAGSTLAK